MKNINKIWYVLILAILIGSLLYIDRGSSRVRFIGDSTEDDAFESPSFGTNAEWCQSQGYNRKGSCPVNEKPGRICSRDSSYFDKCCNLTYNYRTCSYPNERSKDSCGGRYQCLCNKNLYPISECPTPQVPSKDACAEDFYINGNNVSKIYYASCECPHYYKTCDTSLNLIGDTSMEQECKGAYATCKCKAGYDKTCSDYGTKIENDKDYCYLNGTKYYKQSQCRSASEFCAKQGYTNIACPADEMTVQYCPQDSSYFLCRKDPAKYCPNKQYNGVGEFQKWGQCGKYKTQNQNKKCSYTTTSGSTIVFGDYYLCEESCKSQMYDNNYRPLSDGHENIQWYKITTTASLSEAIIIGKNLNFKSELAFRDPYGNSYASIKGITALYEENPTKYSQCQSSYFGTYYHPLSVCYHKSGPANMASINIKEGSALNRNFRNLTIIMNLEQNGGQAIRRTFPITKTATWRNINIGYDNNDQAGTSSVHWYGDRLYALTNASIINISGARLNFYGTNHLCAGSDFSSSAWEDTNSGQRGRHYAIKVNNNSYLDVLGQLNTDVPIYNHGWVDIWGSSNPKLQIYYTGIGSWDNGYTTVRNGGNLTTYILSIQGDRHMIIGSKSSANVTSSKGSSTYIGKDRNLCITGGGSFTTAGLIETCRRGEICLGSGGTSIKVKNWTYNIQNRSYRRKDDSGCDSNANPVANEWFNNTWANRDCQKRCGSPSQ